MARGIKQDAHSVFRKQEKGIKGGIALRIFSFHEMCLLQLLLSDDEQGHLKLHLLGVSKKVCNFA